MFLQHNPFWLCEIACFSWQYIMRFQKMGVYLQKFSKSAAIPPRTVNLVSNYSLRPVHMERFAYVCKYCIYAKFAYVCKSLHVYAFTRVRTYAKVGNLHLPQTKCKSHFAYMQILHICKSGHVNGKQNLHT